jgi:hypothetical protein
VIPTDYFRNSSPDPYIASLAELCRQAEAKLNEVKPFSVIEQEANAESRAIVKGEKK